MQSSVRLNTALLALLLSSTAAPAATTLFEDDFNRTGNLNGSTPNVGGTWALSSANQGSFNMNGSRVTTVYNGTGTNWDNDQIFASFVRPLEAGETITLTFETVNTGAFLSTGWAGISLWVGGNEEIFLGDLSEAQGQWGVAWIPSTGYTSSLFSPAVVGEAHVAEMTYEYDTGRFTATVAGNTMSGTTDPGLALDRIRIGSGANSLWWGAPNSDIAVNSIKVTSAIPEPASLGMLGLAAGAFAMRRRRRA